MDECELGQQKKTEKPVPSRQIILILLSTSDFTKPYYFQNRSFDATAATTGRAFDATAPTNGATAARTGGAAASAATATATTHRFFLLLVSLVI